MLIPTTSPWALTSGPPLLPEVIEAECRMTLRSSESTMVLMLPPEKTTFGAFASAKRPSRRSRYFWSNSRYTAG